MNLKSKDKSFFLLVLIIILIATIYREPATCQTFHANSTQKRLEEK
ncbi:unnamed protein product [Gulo gulo]|uniref:Uncharacterized protein n=1 Tax=Gulo gulo TaxID=48420 RepID=A0A9X9LMM3_GULGU|nr:unnamed protein product [Gulo gulo]